MGCSVGFEHHQSHALNVFTVAEVYLINFIYTVEGKFKRKP